jgi:hypothetical protein
MDSANSQSIVNNPSTLNLTQPNGLKSYLDSWGYGKVRSSEIVTQNLRRQYHLLRNAEKYNKAKELYNTIRKMDRCRHDFVEYHLKGNPHQKQHRPYYCGNKLCPICYSYQSYQRCLQVFSKMLTPGVDMYGVYTFSPKNPSVDRLKHDITKLKKASTKVFNSGYKKLSALINGSIRFMGLTYSFHNSFNSHLHVILHLTHRLTDLEAQNLYEILNQRFKKYMDIDSVESHLGIYIGTFENIKRTAAYLTKYADHMNLSEGIARMDIEAYAAYQDSYAHMREIEFAGCYRGKTASNYSSEGMKQLFKVIHCDDNPPAKIYEFKPPREAE